MHLEFTSVLHEEELAGWLKALISPDFSNVDLTVGQDGKVKFVRTPKPYSLQKGDRK